MRRFYHVEARARRRARQGWLILVGLLVACALAIPIESAVAFAQPEPSVSVSAAPPLTLPTPAQAVASAAPPPPVTPANEIRVRDKVVFIIRAPRGGRTAQERAKAANAAIEALLAHPEDLGDVHYEESQGTAVVYIGKGPVLTLGQEDVEATGEANVTVLAAQASTRLSDAVATERKRSAIATTVFSFSLLVFSALIAFLLLGRASDIATRIRGSFVDDPEKVTGVKLGKIEFLSAGASRGALSIAVTLAYRFVQLAIIYGWAILALSLFDSTRGYTQRLTGMVVTPLSGLASRVAGALPLLVVAAIAALAVSLLVRVVGLFFDSVARGDTRIAWLSRDLARPVSILARSGIVVVALVLASPMITGSDDGALSRIGLVALLSMALASVPLLASVAVGVVVIFARRIKKGDLVEFGGRAGRIAEVSLIDVRLEDAQSCEVTVPHLLALFHPTRVHKHPPLGSIEIVVDPKATLADVEKALLDAAREISSRARVELVYLDDAGAHWRITSATNRGETTLARAVQEALSKHGIGLGRGKQTPREEAR